MFVIKVPIRNANDTLLRGEWETSTLKELGDIAMDRVLKSVKEVLKDSYSEIRMVWLLDSTFTLEGVTNTNCRHVGKGNLLLSFQDRKSYMRFKMMNIDFLDKVSKQCQFKIVGDVQECAPA